MKICHEDNEDDQTLSLQNAEGLLDMIKAKDVVVWTQPEVAIYQNPHDGCVIRAQAIWNDEEDQYISIAPCHLAAVIARLKQFLPR
jgi:hypothetical protein